MALCHGLERFELLCIEIERFGLFRSGGGELGIALACVYARQLLERERTVWT